MCFYDSVTYKFEGDVLWGLSLEPDLNPILHFLFSLRLKTAICYLFRFQWGNCFFTVVLWIAILEYAGKKTLPAFLCQCDVRGNLHLMVPLGDHPCHSYSSRETTLRC